MTQEQYLQLNKIYNTLSLIETKGENTVLMGSCLAAFKETLQILSQTVVVPSDVVEEE